jgi:hypothetical protein
MRLYRLALVCNLALTTICAVLLARLTEGKRVG